MAYIRHLSMFCLLLAAILMTSHANCEAQQQQQPEKIALWPEQAPVGGGKTEQANAFITVYRPVKGNGMAVIICPGGAYGRLITGQEGVGTARWLNTHGIVGIVLEYRLPKGNPNRSLYDVQRAIRMARSKAEMWQCDPTRIGIIGFSAGGHLASSAATHFDYGNQESKDSIEWESSRPDFAILIYPVITMGPSTHALSKRNFLGESPSDAMVELFSNELQVSPQTPPTFLAHAENDNLVIPKNSQMFYDALIANDVQAEYLKLPRGGHGLNGYKGPMWDAWQAESLNWLSSLQMPRN
ncbi:alpha/beta hydrolase [Coraliomargarita sp. W4R53]